MLTDVELALLGDSVSANLLTERGVKLPCACGGEAEIRHRELEVGIWKDSFSLEWEAKCKSCGNSTSTRTYYNLKDDGSIVVVEGSGSRDVLFAWNKRWSAFSPEYFELLRRGASPEAEVLARDLLERLKIHP